MKATLKDTYVYDLFNMSQSVQTIAGTIIPNLQDYIIKSEDLERIMNDIKYRVTIKSKDKMLELLKTGKVLVVNAPGVMLPVWAAPDPKGGVVAVVNIFGKAKESREGILTYQYREIFGLLAMGVVFYNFYSNERQVLTNRSIFINSGAFYSAMMVNMINKAYPIRKSVMTSSGHELLRIYFILTRFYIRNLMERENDPKTEIANIFNILRLNRELRTSIALAKVDEDLALDIPDEAYTNINTLITAMAEHIPSLGKAKAETNIILRQFILTLGEKSVLMIESPQYFLALMTSVAVEGMVIRDYAFKSMMSPEVNVLSIKAATELLNM